MKEEIKKLLQEITLHHLEKITPDEIVITENETDYTATIEIKIPYCKGYINDRLEYNKKKNQ